MRSAAIALLASICIAGPALASDFHNCGDAPSTPTIFDPQTASKAEILNIKSEFDAYKQANTKYIDCIKEASKSDAVQGLKKNKRKQVMAELDGELKGTIDTEQEFAELFNEKARAWVEVQNAKGR